jgi:hypothetical protein
MMRLKVVEIKTRVGFLLVKAHPCYMRLKGNGFVITQKY